MYLRFCGAVCCLANASSSAYHFLRLLFGPVCLADLFQWKQDRLVAVPVQDEQTFPRRQGPARWNHTQCLRPCCSICPQKAVRPPRSGQRMQIDCGISSTASSAIDAVGNSAENIFNRARTQVRIQTIKRTFASQNTVWCLQPINCLFTITNHRHRIGIDPGQSHGAVRFRRSQTRVAA